MNAAIPLHLSPRAEDFAALEAIVPESIEGAAEQVGIEGVQAFFDGYKDSQESSKLAA